MRLGQGQRRPHKQRKAISCELKKLKRFRPIDFKLFLAQVEKAHPLKNPFEIASVTFELMSYR